MSFGEQAQPQQPPSPPANLDAPMFEPLRPQGSFAPDPAGDGFNQFAGVPQAQPSPGLIDQMIAGLRAQNQQPQPHYQPNYQPQPQPMPPPQYAPQYAPQSAPDYDPTLLNQPVVSERLKNLELTYGNAYQQAQDPTIKQAILLAYHGEQAQLLARVEQAKTAAERAQFTQQQMQQQQMLEPVFRMLAAQVLARDLGIPDVNMVLNDPNGQPIWHPETMRINAAYLAQTMTRQNIQQQTSRAIAPIPTGGGAGTDFASFTRTASRDDFMRAVDQAKRTGIRVSMSG